MESNASNMTRDIPAASWACRLHGHRRVDKWHSQAFGMGAWIFTPFDRTGPTKGVARIIRNLAVNPPGPPTARGLSFYDNRDGNHDIVTIESDVQNLARCTEDQADGELPGRSLYGAEPGLQSARDDGAGL